MEAEVGTRTLVVLCPDWSVLASDPEPAAPVIVVRANRVVAASMAARAAGIEVGLKRRESQRRCPAVEVVEHDPGRDARAFEPVASSLDAITPGVEVTHPGTLAFATRGPSRYFGGDDSLAERVAWMVSGALGGRWPVRVGVADGALAALLAAQRAHREGRAAVVVPAGAGAAFLAPHPVSALLDTIEVPEVTDVWQRLGLRTLGHVAALPRGDVAARFGHPGVAGHRLASGLDLRPLAARRPAPDLAVSHELDPPVDRVDQAAFVAKALADRLHAGLGADGLACTQVLIEATTAHGEVLGRCWRHEGALTAGALADRVRWQLDGWLTGSVSSRPTAGVSRLTLVPVEVVAARGRQLGFWGGETLVDERIWRAVARLQGQLGAEAVTVPEVRGGRSPAERVVRIPVAAVDLTEARPATRLASVVEPWPGQVPAPAPATVLTEPAPVLVVDAQGEPVAVSGRSELSAPPAQITFAGRTPVAIAAWTGPWPVDERWWDPGRHRRRARFQVVDRQGAAHLLAVEAGRWWLEATYD
ncbi:DNA polymerase Y family protein [Aquihabitans sp. McL0605]|uniref:DNA polymerase Y family protein n=1 Tax=Aquihabitans sp. McL0605 TaxID=3415671 RepID=UPI003CE801CF